MTTLITAAKETSKSTESLADVIVTRRHNELCNGLE